MKKLLINKKNVTLVIGIAVVMPLLSLMNVQMSVQFGAVIDRMQITSVFIRSLLALIVITALTYFLDKILLSFFLTRLSCNFVTSLHHALIRKFHTMNYPSFLKRNPTGLFQICSKDMLQNSLMGICMKNAADNVKRKARYITAEDNNNNGACIALVELLGLSQKLKSEKKLY